MLEKYYDKYVRIKTNIGSIIEGTVGDYFYPGEIENEKESIVVDTDDGRLIEFYEADIMEINVVKYVGWFSEMQLYHDDGSIKDYLVDAVDYDKAKVIKYLKKHAFRVAGCPSYAIDCVTGETIAPSFSVYDDGEYKWCDFLAYHIEKYNIRLPEGLIQKAETNASFKDKYYDEYLDLHHPYYIITPLKAECAYDVYYDPHIIDDIFKNSDYLAMEFREDTFVYMEPKLFDIINAKFDLLINMYEDEVLEEQHLAETKELVNLLIQTSTDQRQIDFCKAFLKLVDAAIEHGTIIIFWF